MCASVVVHFHHCFLACLPQRGLVLDPSGSSCLLYQFCDLFYFQDILGIMFSINMLKVLRLPSLRICTILLSALFFYDIFFVFITPLFMSGKSVMVEVATGHSSDEQLPMVKQN